MPGVPKYRQIADDLRARINAGEFADGKLPGETTLREQYGAAIGTLRSALKALHDEGITEARHGRGVFIRSFRPIVRNSVGRLSKEQWGAGKSIWQVDVDDRDFEPADVRVELIPADEDIARMFDLPERAPIWRRGRKYLVDGVSVIRSVSYIPDDLARGTRITQIDTGPGGTYKQLAEAGHAPVRFREELRCRMASDQEVADLGLGGPAPVVDLTRYAYGERDDLVELNRMVLDASRYLLQYDFPA